MNKVPKPPGESGAEITDWRDLRPGVLYADRAGHPWWASQYRRNEVSLVDGAGARVDASSAMFMGPFTVLHDPQGGAR